MGHGRAIINEKIWTQTDIYKNSVKTSVRDFGKKLSEESKPKPTKISSSFEIEETQKKVLLIILEAK
jgi:hypothetical protein